MLPLVPVNASTRQPCLRHRGIMIALTHGFQNECDAQWETLGVASRLRLSSAFLRAAAAARRAKAPSLRLRSVAAVAAANSASPPLRGRRQSAAANSAAAAELATETDSELGPDLNLEPELEPEPELDEVRRSLVLLQTRLSQWSQRHPW